MNDLDDRLTRIEASHDVQRRAWVAKAAERAGLHRPADAVELVDIQKVVSNADADRLVAGLLETHPYLAPQMVTEEEQRAIWGQQILDRIDKA
jgi:hypothetical protein